MKKLDEHIGRVGLVANPDKPAGRALVRKALRAVAATGREVECDPQTIKLAGLEGQTGRSPSELAARCDLLLALGGDGTMLRVAREAAGSGTPILGINLGTLGFLTAAPASRLSPTLEQVWAGHCLVEARPLIEAQPALAGTEPAEVALNDFVISRGTVPRLIELEVRVDGDLLTSYRADGLILSSPTGSTAYSLAAGGAVVTPRAEVFALTPICPHTLSNRSVIVSLHAIIEVKLRSERVETFLTADGQVITQLQAGQTLVFRRSRHAAHLVRLPGTSFFDTLRQKLNWSGSSTKISAA
ncbi:MAG: NAD(+)/NADH kinase [Verrucomicrobia bacterium]|nr:NAD(+)/NADH kinase [Verrucomicrobiota bacterium]